MKLLKQINENTAGMTPVVVEDAADGAVDAGAVASCAMPLFSKLVAQTTPKVRTIKWTSKPGPVAAVPKKKKLGLKEAFYTLTEFSPMSGDSGAMSMNMDGTPAANGSTDAFDSAAVIAKLKGLEDQERQQQGDTVSFGLEDENGGLVRVTVSQEQAEEFERTLQAFLAKAEQDTDGVPEIAEVLFKLKDRFDIINVQWPDVQEDEEENVGLKGEEGMDAEAGDTEGTEGDLDLDAEVESDAGASEDDVRGLLTQVIDMMKADADARKAEAKAKEAEAKAKEADAIVKQTMSKVKQEEQFLDMEQYDKSKKEEEREVKRLAKLARWKHDMKQDGEMDEEDDIDVESLLSAKPEQKVAPAAPAAREEEELRRPSKVVAQPAKKASTIRGRLHPHDIASFILSRVK